MEFLDYGHNIPLVVMSLFVAVVAGFTGLSLTKNLSEKSIPHRKVSIAMAAVALGGGIWSMHFVAMLGLQLPILFYYDAAITLASALIAILIVGAALVLLHFTQRNRTVIALAGALVGAGVLVMHYVGMAGLQLCRAVYTPLGVGMSSVAAIALCILAFGVAYGRRTNRNIFIGTLCFGAAVFAVHFLAMAGTRFVAVPQLVEFGPTISNETMAIGVIFSSFVIFGAFLWVSTAYLPASGASESLSVEAVEAESLETPTPEPVVTPNFHIPCERDGNKVFVLADEVAFVRADGHYSQVYTDTERHFCVWPITEASKRLLPVGFVKVHRSYIVNPAKVARFERTKDKGRCSFASSDTPVAPVSRSHLKDVQAALSV